MSGLGDALLATGPSDSDAENLALFGRFVGAWNVSNSYCTEPGGEWSSSEFSWTFGWIIDGRGIQDVIVAGDGSVGGTTVRTYDSGIAAWRVVWFSPRNREHCSLIARPHGTDGIWQHGTQADGRAIRWNFSEITPESFRWDGWCSEDGGTTWWHEQHMDAVRA